MTDTKKTPTRPDVEGAHKLAHDCVTMTLHGPLPLPTSMKLAEHILALHGWIAHLERRSPEPTEDDEKVAEKYLRKRGRGGFPTAASEREAAFLAGCEHGRASTRSPDETRDLRAMAALRKCDSVENRDMVFVAIEDYTRAKWDGEDTEDLDLAIAILATLGRDEAEDGR